MTVGMAGVIRISQPSDYVPIEIKPKGFVLRHKLSQASVTPSYAGQSLSFDVYGHIAEWPFIVVLASGIEYNHAMTLASGFDGVKYVSDLHESELKAELDKEAKATDKKSKLDREKVLLGCSIDEAVSTSLLKIKAKAIALRHSPVKDESAKMERKLREMRHVVFDVEEYLIALIHDLNVQEWSFGTLFEDIKLKFSER